ncbi:hypothetical protein NQ317_009523 [Molorchus minor]|uniref:Uncharacterized protein n=1 Tax=Molorchus minor TaxID=1323400 RepID=A0ABQ9J0P8_9CUCU|nr:hypothetical protein NQ317_009523 [Molorchus minor]
MTLADGIERSVITHVFNIAIQIKHKRILIDLIAVPEHGDSRPLLGVDFIQQANILPDMKLNCWYFGDDLTTPYAFTEEYPPTEETRTNIDMVSQEIRDDEGSSLTPPEKLELNSLTNLKPAGLLQTPVQSQRFETLSVDLFGPLPETTEGFKWIFIVEDTASHGYIESNNQNPGQDQNFVPQITVFLDRLSETLRIAGETQKRSQDSSKKYANEKRRNVSPFKVGDRVMVDTHTLSRASHSFTSKFAPKRDGPHIIHRVITPTSFEIFKNPRPNSPPGNTIFLHSLPIVVQKTKFL